MPASLWPFRARPRARRSSAEHSERLKMSRILVINPNSSIEMTRSIDEGLDILRSPGGPEIVTTYLEGAPEGIETQLDVESVVLPLLERLKDEEADAVVLACYSD